MEVYDSNSFHSRKNMSNSESGAQGKLMNSQDEMPTKWSYDSRHFSRTGNMAHKNSVGNFIIVKNVF